ncbi:hypothetical protein ACUN8C_01635 [Kushneria sp. Sum13]|uniref:hypothetical protein n=1 Tax=Kushneria sp. Sum13 TaxID=3459196 RepID=UPI0040452372
MRIKSSLGNFLNKSIKIKTLLKLILAVMAIAALIFFLGAEYILTTLRGKLPFVVFIFILFLFFRKWFVNNFQQLESVNFFGFNFLFKKERKDSCAGSEEDLAERAVNVDGCSSIEEAEKDIDESDENFLKRVEDKETSSLSEEEMRRYYNIVKPDENFSSFEYDSFFYQPSALVPISRSARAFLYDNDFLELALGKVSVSTGHIFKAWQKIEFIISELNRKNGGNEISPSSGGPDPEPRKVISFEDKLTYLIGQDSLSSGVTSKIFKANRVQESIGSHEVEEIDTIEARKFVDLVISIINKFEDEHGYI